jgi:RNA polymerase sigma-70 factor (ECF subfamily)
MDESRVRALLEQHHVSGYGWALSCCSRDPGRAEDVLQTVYLKILLGKARYKGRASFQTWLFSVIRKTAAEERRRSFFRRLKLREYEQLNRQMNPHNSSRQGIDPFEELSMFREALTALPKRQQEVLHLVFYQDLAVQEAAKIMGVSLGSARTHYERGKRRLRESLQKSEVFHDRES